MPAAAAAVAGLLPGNRNTAAQTYFDQQSPEDQAAIRASWNTPGQGGIAVGNSGLVARPGSRLGDGVMLREWYNNANKAGAVPPPPVPAPAGPAQSAPGLTAAPQPAPQPGPPGGYGGYNPAANAPISNGPAPTVGGAPAPAVTPATASATGSIAGVVANNFAPGAKKPFDYEAAKAQYGAGEARRMQNEA